MPQPSIADSVVRQLRLRHGVSRVELARQLAVAPSTVGIHVDRLVDDGFLREGRLLRTGSGRPPTVVELNPEAGQFIGIDLDAREIYAVSVDFAQRKIQQRIEPIRPTDRADDVVSRIATAIESVRDDSRELLGVGLAIPGTVDAESRIGLHYEFIEGWTNVEIGSRIGAAFDVPILIENNIRAMALAERWFGSGVDCENFLCVGVRSGIGSGIVLNGELYRGVNGLAGEIGNWPVASNGSGTVTLEQIASLRVIQQTLTRVIHAGHPTGLKLVNRTVPVEQILAQAAAGNPLVQDTLKTAANAIGQVLAQLSLTLNPSRLIICGPLADLETAFVSPLRESMTAVMPAFHSRIPEVICSNLGQLTGALGAAALATQAWHHTS